MNTTYTELNSHIEFLKKEIDKMLDTLAEMLCSEDTTETEYAERLAAY